LGATANPIGKARRLIQMDDSRAGPTQQITEDQIIQTRTSTLQLVLLQYNPALASRSRRISEKMEE